MSIGPKRREAPTEPLKRAVGLCVRAIAGHADLEVGFAAGAPEYSTGHVQLPEPSRVPSQREIAVIRGWADSFALTAGCHDVRVHNKLAPSAGPARLVFEAAERARVEALGANRMPGMARNLTARIEDQYAHGRFAQVKTRADAPLEDAVALLIRERLTGMPPPDSAKALVDVWRPSIEQRGAKLLKRLDSLAEDQESFGRLMRDLLRAFGSVPLALAAYNAGPDRVRSCGCVPAIPETQSYVADILGLLHGAGDPSGDGAGALEVRLVR